MHVTSLMQKEQKKGSCSKLEACIAAIWLPAIYICAPDTVKGEAITIDQKSLVNIDQVHDKTASTCILFILIVHPALGTQQA